MKLKNIAKASLALGILTTGIITTTAQPVKANSTISVISNGTKELSEYYKGPYFEYKNQSGYKEREGTVSFIQNMQQTDVTLTGSEKIQFNNDDEVSNVDVFVVRENTDRSGLTKSIGGITKTNTQNHKDYVKNVGLNVTKKIDNNASKMTSNPYNINKEEISLKELDFKLRKQLIDNHDLYKTEPKNSKIRVVMENGDYYTFELNKKLQEHRMGDVIDGTKIKEINVELN
ncbi:exotoxin beta-grasp domain-containing protein [Staphylococcus schweitzeri]|uniref:Exotoxin n=1 Tax=Staphylococcus schweitzeri TaxID=1654388 RepID=A0A077UL65_9STAP|nr:superantigen-like protein [Staphylococcus schweitzeri]CDR29280.1 exotoxin [Staphylococcus schweitzeri]